MWRKLRLWLLGLLGLIAAAEGTGLTTIHAFMPGIGSTGGFWGGAGSVELATATIAGDECDLTNVDSTVYTQTIDDTGASDSDEVYIVVLLAGEDSATVFGVSGVTIDGVAATEVVDEDGTGLVNTAIYRASAKVTSAASVVVETTYTEATTSNWVCAFAFKNLDTLTPTSSVVDDDTSSAALVLTLGTTTTDGAAIGICIDAGTGNNATWAVLTEYDESGASENRMGTATGATTGASMAVTCDWSGTNDASGAAVAFGD